MAKIQALCLSEKRGTPKNPVEEIEFIAGHGIAGDAHAGDWHRQVSLLSAEQVNAFREKGAEVAEGAFGENVLVTGLDLARLPVGMLLYAGPALLEVTQIGKECHSHCAIHEQVGDCIMPREGIFARVLRGGIVRVGDAIGRPVRTGIITLSDRASQGLRRDLSGPAIKERLGEDSRYLVIKEALIPDDLSELQGLLTDWSDTGDVDLIFTTGSTGFAPRDIAPEATILVAERDAPGIADAMRAHSLTITKRAMLSRGVSVIRGATLIINLPGSPKACSECLDCVQDTLPHGIDLLREDVGDCGQQ